MSTHDTVYLKDYLPPAYLTETVTLDVDFQQEDEATVAWVSAVMVFQQNPAYTGETGCLLLYGEALETWCFDIEDVVTGRIAPARFVATPQGRMLSCLPARFVLRTRVKIYPDGNTCLSGLYRSRNGYFTQCEAEGFRRITWFPDRPDVMACYTVTLHADRASYPALLSNGNLVAAGDVADGRLYATWHDPFPKPCYLFALVAARLEALRDCFVTNSGRSVSLAIYAETDKLGQCAHAMQALKKAMRWDEQRFHLECDLDQYMIVVVSDFNMGAMENKGLNIFNAKYVLADLATATDADFENIDRVVAHEYFHNWTGNRVTCRDWFQLSLKEGLTVFRDQEFGADTHGCEVARIREVRGLRAMQFSEDAGPMAHPVRPESYVEINNFYTATVYEKGAEVVRMIQTLIGGEAFDAGIAEYFRRHDGQAVTCEDFAAAMAVASGLDFSPFMAWYRQAGTPRVMARGEYDAAARRYRLTLTQSCPPTPGQPEKLPYLIPVAIGLVGPDGCDVDLGEQPGMSTRVLRLVDVEQHFVFENVPVEPVPSLLRSFSAPVILDYPYSDADLTHLLAHDADPFNRWEAGQRLFCRLILGNAARLACGEQAAWPTSIVVAVQTVLESGSDAAFIAEALALPGESTLAGQMAVVDPEALFQARHGLARWLAGALERELVMLYENLAPTGAYCWNKEEAARRRLRNLCLDYLNRLDKVDYRALAFRQFREADNMTDRFGALAVLARCDGAERVVALREFHDRWQHEALVVDKWLSVQAGSSLPGTLQCVEELTRHPAFDWHNPNKVYALLCGFGANHRHFHAADGGGYRFLAEWVVRLDPINPQVAARLARCFDRWRNFDETHQSQARAALEILRRSTCSPGVQEIVLRQVSCA
jgi:aminopeptidase N